MKVNETLASLRNSTRDVFDHPKYTGKQNKFGEYDFALPYHFETKEGEMAYNPNDELISWNGDGTFPDFVNDSIDSELIKSGIYIETSQYPDQKRIPIYVPLNGTLRTEENFNENFRYVPKLKVTSENYKNVEDIIKYSLVRNYLVTNEFVYYTHENNPDMGNPDTDLKNFIEENEIDDIHDVDTDNFDEADEPYPDEWYTWNVRKVAKVTMNSTYIDYSDCIPDYSKIKKVEYKNQMFLLGDLVQIIMESIDVDTNEDDVVGDGTMMADEILDYLSNIDVIGKAMDSIPEKEYHDEINSLEMFPLLYNPENNKIRMNIPIVHVESDKPKIGDLLLKIHNNKSIEILFNGDPDGIYRKNDLIPCLIHRILKIDHSLSTGDIKNLVDWSGNSDKKLITNCEMIINKVEKSIFVDVKINNYDITKSYMVNYND